MNEDLYYLFPIIERNYIQNRITRKGEIDIIFRPYRTSKMGVLDTLKMAIEEECDIYTSNGMLIRYELFWENPYTPGVDYE